MNVVDPCWYHVIAGPCRLIAIFTCVIVASLLSSRVISWSCRHSTLALPCHRLHGCCRHLVIVILVCPGHVVLVLWPPRLVSFLDQPSLSCPSCVIIVPHHQSVIVLMNRGGVLTGVPHHRLCPFMGVGYCLCSFSGVLCRLGLHWWSLWLMMWHCHVTVGCFIVGCSWLMAAVAVGDGGDAGGW